MRGKPFWQRIEKAYTLQTTRATVDGLPAMLQPSFTASFKWSPKISTGAGLAANIGLGKDWSHIKITLQGVGFRTFVQWQWMYGIGLYAGYERVYKQYFFTSTNKSTELSSATSTHNSKNWAESFPIGITKIYKLNSKWNGAVQVLYDVWWRDKNLRSPIILRVSQMQL